MLAGGESILIKKCVVCGSEFESNSNRQIYCKQCNKDKRLRQMRHYVWKLRNLGTTPFHEHRHSDFSKEYEDIKREKKRLGL